MRYNRFIPEGGSTLISFISYSEQNKELTIQFRKYFVNELTYLGVSYEKFKQFVGAKSLGKFYLSDIKPIYKIKTTQIMADKIIKLKINVSKINKAWLFQGEQGTYLNMTLLYNEEKDKYGNCGMVVQDVPKSVYGEDKNKKWDNILGNGKEFEKKISEESKPGVESGKMGVTDDIADDLPF